MQFTLCSVPACAQITGRKVAIKRISKVFLDLIDAKRILREIKLLRHLGKNENIIEILDIMTGVFALCLWRGVGIFACDMTVTACCHALGGRDAIAQHRSFRCVLCPFRLLHDLLVCTAS